MEQKTREQIVEEYCAARDLADKLCSQLAQMDYNDRKAVIEPFVGRYFKEVQCESYKEHVQVYHTFKLTEEERCELLSIEVSYWVNNEDTHFTIGHTEMCRPYKGEDDDWDAEYEEITKEQFEYHYQQVRMRINKALGKE